MRSVIVLCDNTMGLPDKPMDDALALYYLLSKPEAIRILGVCATYGNGTAEESAAVNRSLLRELGRGEIPVLMGAEQGERAESEAAEFIAAAAQDAPGQISCLSLGAVTDLYGALLLRSETLGDLREIVFMGGITAPLLFHAQPLHELNLSIDHASACAVLTGGHDLSVITGNRCLDTAYLPGEEFFRNMVEEGTDASRLIAAHCGYRFQDKRERYGAFGSYCWDAVAAAYLAEPELFRDDPISCRITLRDMEDGYVHPADPAESNCVLNIPAVRDPSSFPAVLYRAWRSLKVMG